MTTDNGNEYVYWEGTTISDGYSSNKPWQSFANTYYKTAFDPAVRSSRSFKLNPYFPANHPPTDDQEDQLRGASLIHL